MSDRSHSYSRRRRRKRQSNVLSMLYSMLLLASVLVVSWTALTKLLDFSSGDPEKQTPGGLADALVSSSPEPAANVQPSEAAEPDVTPEPTEKLPATMEEVDEKEAWKLQLVNWENPLPEDFTAPDLVLLRNNQSIDARAYPELQAMMDAARAEGLQPLICSSFRTYKVQTELYQAEVQRTLAQGYAQSEAEERAAMWVARPGTSEHELGLAVDIVDTNYQILDRRQEYTAVQQWLIAHSWEYGFILRYPTDKSEITHIGYEPWHYRYVGKEAAKEITESGLCLEEYLGQWAASVGTNP